MKKLFIALLVLIQAQLAFGQATQTFVTTTGVQTLTNKTLVSPNLGGTPAVNANLILRFGGATHIQPWTVGPTLPSTCEPGDAHFRTDAIPGSNIYLCTSTNTWTQNAGGGGGSGDFATNTATSVDNELVLFSGTSGKLAKRATGTGLLRMSSGVLSAYTLTAGSSKIVITNGNGSAGTPTVDALESAFTIANLGGSLPAAKLPALTGDVTSTAGTGVTALASIPSATPLLGHLLATNIAPPGTPVTGKTDVYVDSTQKILSAKNDAGNVSTTAFSHDCSTQFVKAFNADGTFTCASPSGSGDTSTNTATSVANELAMFADTTGKLLKRSTLTGLLKSTSGVASAAVSGTDYAPATSGSSVLKGNGAGGFSAAVQGTDFYQPGGSAVQIADGGTAATTAAAARTNLGLAIGSNVAPATPAGTAILKANNAGGFSSAVAGTDYASATSGSGVLKGASGNTAAATADDIGSPLFCADAGSTDSYACSLSPAITAYTTGRSYYVKANTANTGPATLNLNTLGAKTIKKTSAGITTDLDDNDIKAGQMIHVMYDGTNLQLLGGTGSGGGTAASIAFTPGGTLSSTDVQAALLELDTNKISGENDDLQSVSNRGRSDFGANNVTNGQRVGKDINDHWLRGHDPTVGLFDYGVCGGVINGCDYYRTLNAGKHGGFRDSDGNVFVDFAEADGATTYPYASKRPRKWISIPAGSFSKLDGTNCVFADATLNTGQSPTVHVMRCADNASGTFQFDVNMYGSHWDGSPLKIRLFGTHTTTETVTWASDIKAQCRGLGDAVNATWSTPINVDVSITTANVRVASSELDLTPNGSCAPDDKIYGFGTIDATTMSTNAANFNVEEIQLGYLVDRD